MRKVLTLACVLALLGSGWALAATNSSLKGEVMDEGGAGLPGATVTITSPTQLGGARTTEPEADGSFSFANVDPGFFTVRVELDGFVAQELSEVQVRAGRTQTLEVKMGSGEFEETVQVTAEAPVIDPEQISLATNFSEEYLQKSAVGSGNRSYQSVLTQAAGVAGGSNPNVLGSTLGENAYYFDGINTTDPVTATWSGNYSFDIIQEVSLETGGFEAQYGGATGGVVNVVTKSGGNEFAGSFDIRYSDDSFFERGEFFDPDTQNQKREFPSATLGGPIVRDKIWFFANYNPVTTESTATGSPTTRTFTGDYWFSKLSFQLNPNWRLVLKANGDPTEIENVAGSAAFRPPETQSLQEQGGDLYQFDLSGVLGSNLLWDGRIGITRRELNNFPITGDLETPGFSNVSTGFFSVNNTNAQFSDRDRDILASNINWFKDDWGGDHEFRAGFEASDTFFKSQNFTTGNYSFTLRTVNGADIPRNFTNNPNRDVSEFNGEVRSAYLQDGWSVTPNLTLKLGVRYDQAGFENNVGDQTADFDKIQPRLGLAWDITGDGKTIGRLTAGRFMHPSALTSASFAERGANTAPVTTAWSCEYVRQFTFGLPPNSGFPCSTLAGIVNGAFGWQGNIVQEPQGLDPDGWIVSTVTGGEGQPNVVTPGLESTYQDTFIVGVERQLWKRTSLEISYVNKETYDIFEDTCDGALGNPQAGHACNFYVIDNLPGLTRDYQGVLARFESRATRWLYLTSSVTWSESKGNVTYTQNAGSAFDYFPDHYVNRYGLLGDHRRWRFKVNGFVDLPAGFSLGIDAFWSSPSRYTLNQTAENAGYGVEFLEPRGSLEGNENYQLDVNLTKSFRFGRYDVQLIGTVFNVFDSERPTDRCDDNEGCGTLGGLLDPLEWQDPRRYEVGFRFEF